MSTKAMLVLVAMLLLLGACFSPHPTSTNRPVDLDGSTVAGTWLNEETRATLTFYEDGTFTTTDLPYQMYEHYFPDHLPDGFDPERDRLPASGEWVLTTPLGNPDGPSNTIILRVHLLAGAVDRTSFDLRAEHQSGVVVISYYLGDPDLGARIVYKRCDIDCAPAETSQPELGAVGPTGGRQ